MNELLEYGKLLKQATEKLSIEDADSVIENTLSIIERTYCNMDLTDKKWETKLKELLHYVREMCNVAFAIYNAGEGLIPACVSRVLVELAYLHRTVVEEDCDEDVRDELDELLADFIYDISSGEVLIQDKQHWFKIEDIKISEKNQSAKEDEISQEEIDKWYFENINLDAEVDALEDVDYEVLKKALKSNKLVSIGSIKEDFSLGYNGAGMIMERLEEAGAVSSMNAIDGLGTKRIVRVTLDMLK